MFLPRLLVLMVLAAVPVNVVEVWAGSQPLPDTARFSRQYVLIITGTELLEGKFADGHTQFLTQTLSALGLKCSASLTVRDTSLDLSNALEFASTRADLILVTGGLGPTTDDITRNTLAGFSRIPLVENQDVLNHLGQRFSVRPGDLRENIRRQAMTPKLGTYLSNPNGTAVGLVFDRGDQVLVALPGPPQELRPMVLSELMPWLAVRFGRGSLGTHLQMRFVGIGESSIDKTMEDHLVLPADLTVSSLFDAGRVDVTFSLPGDGEGEKRRLKKLEATLLEQIGEYMYSDEGETLEQHVIKLLSLRGLTLGLAEIASGGAVAASLNCLPKSVEVLRGGFTAASLKELSDLIPLIPQEDQHEDEVWSLVIRICSTLNCPLALVVLEDRIDGGHRTVKVVLGSQEGIRAEAELPVRSSGLTMQKWLVTNVLDFLRRELGNQREARR